MGLKQRHGVPRLTDELRPLQRKSRGSKPAPSGAEDKSPPRKLSPVSYRAHSLPVSENLLEQDVYASGPNQR